MLVLFLSACLIGTVKDLEAELAQLEEELEDLEDEVDELESVDSSADDSGLDDSGEGDSEEEWVVPVSVVFSSQYNSGSYTIVWQVDGDVYNVRTTVNTTSMETSEGDLCGVIEANSGYPTFMVETWSAAGYECWATHTTIWPSCTFPAQVGPLSCDSST